MSAEQTLTPLGRLVCAFRERRFALLLAFLVVSIAGQSVLFGFGFSGQWLDGLMWLLTLVTICSLCFELHQRLFALLVGTPALVFSLGGQAISGETGDVVQVVGQLCEMVFFFGAAGLVVKALFSRLSISLDSVMGAACGYLFVGLGWAVCYTLIERFQPQSFKLSNSLVELGDRSQTLPHLLTYYSFVTLTTVGYGDVTPMSPAARTLAWMEAITGQFYLGVIVAGLVSIIVANNSRTKPERFSPASPLRGPMFADDRNIRRVFQEMFCVQDIAEALPSFDDTADGEHVRSVMVANGLEVVGIRQNGIIAGYVEQSDLRSGCCREVMRPLADARVVADTLPLAALILRLKDQQRLFVLAFGQISGVVNRGNIQKPPGRMWLFGMITLIEMRFSRMIEQLCPDESWKTYLSEGRLEKVQQLLELRRSRHQQPSLADCLQFADKISIIARNTQLRSLTRFQSKRETEETGKQLENLRNSLAHSQDIVANDWQTIVALAEQLDSVLAGPPGTSDAQTQAPQY